MKYKVLAADDEFWSRENIRNLIPWEEYSLEFPQPISKHREGGGVFLFSLSSSHFSINMSAKVSATFFCTTAYFSYVFATFEKRLSTKSLSDISS